MSLGYTRDSIANLRSLVHDDDQEEEAYRPRLHRDSSENSLNTFELFDTDQDNIEPDIQRHLLLTHSPTSSLVSAQTFDCLVPANGIKDKDVPHTATIAPIPNTSSTGLKRNDSSESYGSGSRSNQDVVNEYRKIQSTYSGFSDYSEYYVDPYAINYGDVILGEGRENRNLFCCFFPFLNVFVKQQVSTTLLKNTESNEEKVALQQQQQPSIDTTSIPSITKIPTVTESELLKSSLPLTTSTIANKNATADNENAKLVLPLKSIMRKKFARSTMTASTSIPLNHKKEDSNSRRNLFPVFDTSMRSMSSMDSINSSTSKQESKKLIFFMMARVITVESRKDLTDMERAKIWWQPSDYDDFKKTARIITQAMIQGGSEIWLQTSNAWGKKQQANKGRNTATVNGDEAAHYKAVQRYGKREQDLDEDDPTSSIDSYESKWWCKFGHSRRGLEHVVSIEEGKQRQQNVKTAIRAVLDEQDRQMRSLNKDPKKLSSISMQYTSWARDLAHAAGLADAEAVQSKFDMNAKTRFDYLKKEMNQSAVRGGINSGTNLTTANFILSANKIATATILDANTRRSIPTNLKKEIIQVPGSGEVKDVIQRNIPKGPISLSVGTFPINPEGAESSSSDVFFQQEIHDPDGSHENIAKLAAGYGHRKNDIIGIGNLPPSKRIGAF